MFYKTSQIRIGQISEILHFEFFIHVIGNDEIIHWGKLYDLYERIMYVSCIDNYECNISLKCIIMKFENIVMFRYFSAKTILSCSSYYQP